VKTSPKRIGHAYKYYVTPSGDSVLLAERDEVQRVADIVLRSTSIHEF
jgi:hypothetical protein